MHWLGRESVATASTIYFLPPDAVQFHRRMDIKELDVTVLLAKRLAMDLLCAFEGVHCVIAPSSWSCSRVCRQRNRVDCSHITCSSLRTGLSNRASSIYLGLCTEVRCVVLKHSLGAQGTPVEHLTGPLRRVRPTSSPPRVSHRCTRGSRGYAELVAGVPDAHAAFERALQSTGIGLADVAFFAAMGWSTHAGRSTSVELKEQKWK